MLLRISLHVTLVFLVEAADDICYRIIDFEDAFRLGIISIEKIAELFLAFFDSESGYDARTKVEQSFNGIKDDNKKIQFLRARIINLLVQKLCDIFMQHEDALLSGALGRSLMDMLPDTHSEIINTIDQYSVSNIYNHRSVVEVELAGYNIIGYLLNAFVYAVLQPNSAKAKKLRNLIPAQFVINDGNNSLYSNLQAITDFIAGMTTCMLWICIRK